VLVLHGSGGLERNARGYARAQALAAAGIDAWLVQYGTVADM
jgi:hypothetical protein